jgi:hypothetical protein
MNRLSTRPRPSPVPASTVVATLDMNHEVERDIHAFLTRACSGRWPMWRVLGMKRLGDTLFVCVKWLRCADGRYSLVAVSLDRIALRWCYFPTASAGCSALAALDARHSSPHPPTAPTAPMAG